ncbi:Senescence-specific cysteine protease SAG39 [Hibiscus syriacus]|uniref:Senescence-specific cysteine protease SAG39 n=1 Tax=Hibiscus syriacus TaxID=106335 RepID=A0A6A2XGC5_HIBSY|nr:Senescence-specific cysteine protease SAG39 [Hibiscus syriacus]
MLFSAMEGITKLKTGTLISLSEQELVDCDVNGEDQGCNGGLMDDAFEFIISNQGLTTETNYPYEGVDGSCNKKESANHAAKITGYEDVPSNNRGVTAVGHGQDDDGTKYWLVKNLCGTSWGEDGCNRMERGIDAKEGLAMEASYQLLEENTLSDINGFAPHQSCHCVASENGSSIYTNCPTLVACKVVEFV